MSHTAPNPVEGIAENSCVVATLFRSLFAQCRDMAALKLFEGYHRKGMAQHVWVHAQRYTDVGAPGRWPRGTDPSTSTPTTGIPRSVSQNEAGSNPRSPAMYRRRRSVWSRLETFTRALTPAFV